MTAENILRLAHVYAIKGEYEPFRTAVESLVAERDALAEFAQGLIDDYQSDDGLASAKHIVLAATAALRGQP